MIWRLCVCTAVPSNRLNRGRAAKGCLTTPGIIVLLLLIGGLYFESRRPRFSDTSPSTIDVHVEDSASTNATVYQVSITNRAACETVLREFSQARPYIDQKKAVGKFTFHYDSGKTDVVWMISNSHGWRCRDDTFIRFIKCVSSRGRPTTRCINFWRGEG